MITVGFDALPAMAGLRAEAGAARAAITSLRSSQRRDPPLGGRQVLLRGW